MSKSENMKKIATETGSDWLAKASERAANRGARRNARKVALRVLERMKELAINQTELAEKLGVTRQQVSKIVKGQENFTFETIEKLEKALGITLMVIDMGEEKKEGRIHGRLMEVLGVWQSSVSVQSAGLLNELYCHFSRIDSNELINAPLAPPSISKSRIWCIFDRDSAKKAIAIAESIGGVQTVSSVNFGSTGYASPADIQELELFNS